MSNELRITSTPGNIVYGPIVNDAGLFWNPTAATPAFEAYGTSGDDHTVYAIAANETPSSGTSGLFLGNFPTTIPIGVYWWLPRIQLSGSSGSPADTDPWAGAPQKINWTGSAESFLLASSAADATAVGMTGTSINAYSTGGAGMQLASEVLSISASTTPTDSADVEILDDSQTATFAVIAPAGASVYWEMKFRESAGAAGVICANGQDVTPSFGKGYPVPAGATNHFLNQNRPKAYSIYFTVWLSAGTGTVTIPVTT